MMYCSVAFKAIPRDPSIQIIQTLGHEACKLVAYIGLIMWIPRVSG